MVLPKGGAPGSGDQEEEYDSDMLPSDEGGDIVTVNGEEVEPSTPSSPKPKTNDDSSAVEPSSPEETPTPGDDDVEVVEPSKDTEESKAAATPKAEAEEPKAKAEEEEGGETEDGADSNSEDEEGVQKILVRFHDREGEYRTMHLRIDATWQSIYNAVLDKFHVDPSEGAHYALYLRVVSKDGKKDEVPVMPLDCPGSFTNDLIQRHAMLDAAPTATERPSTFSFIFSDVPPWCARALESRDLGITGQNMTALPSAVTRLHTLTSLSLERNKLTTLPADLARLTGLTQLSLTRNLFKEIPACVYKLTGLTKLDVGSNELTHIGEDIQNLKNLTNLILYVNNLTDMPSSMPALTKLSTLSLTYNSLAEFPPALLHVTSLTQIRLACNQITEIPHDVTCMASLMFLDLRNNKLTTLPSSLNLLTNLKNLNARSNQITSLPKGLSSIVNSIFLSENQITSLPDDFGINTTHTVHLTDNLLTELPSTPMTTVSALVISNNLLTSLPPSISQYKVLKKLIAPNNKLTCLPDAICKLDALTELYLNNNQITHLPKDIHMVPLQRLELSRNKLTGLPTKFWSNTSLVSVNLSGNNLQSIPAVPSQFPQKVSPLRLFLGDNKDLTEDAIVKLAPMKKVLRVLHLGYCNISKIPQEIKELTHLMFLIVSGNKKIGENEESLQHLGFMEELCEVYMAGCGLKTIKSLNLRPSKEKLLVMDFSANDLTELPLWFGSLKSLRDLHLCGNSNLNKLPGTMNNLNGLKIFDLLGCGIITGSAEDHDNLWPRAESAIAHARSLTLTDQKYPYGIAEMQGHRPHMEDAVSVAGDINAEGAQLFAVFDGHGGAQVAQACARAQQTLVKELISRGESVYQALEHSYSHMASSLQMSQIRASTCGSTAVIGIVEPTGVLHMSNAGDARAVLDRSGTALRVTFDHKPLLPSEEARIRGEGCFVTEEGRVNGILAVGRSLGDFALSPGVSFVPYMETIPLLEGDGRLIIACDGVWDVMEDQEAVDLIRDIKDNQEAACALRDLAFLYGSTDNITAMVIDISDAAPSPQAAGGDEVVSEVETQTETESEDDSKKEEVLASPVVAVAEGELSSPEESAPPTPVVAVEVEEVVVALEDKKEVESSEEEVEESSEEEKEVEVEVEAPVAEEEDSPASSVASSVASSDNESESEVESEAEAEEEAA